LFFCQKNNALRMSKRKIIIVLVLWVQLFFILTAREIEIDNETELHKLPNDTISEHYYFNLNLVTIKKGYFLFQWHLLYFLQTQCP